MSYFGDYQRKAITPGNVDQDGDYEVTIIGTKQGELTNDRGKQRYVQVECSVAHKNNPKISIFLTEGPSFDGNFTAFCDTFGISPNCKTFDEWKGKRGWIHIVLKQKGDFINMIPRWILGDDNYVLEDVRRAANGGTASQVQQQAAAVQNTFGATDEELGDIPF